MFVALATQQAMRMRLLSFLTYPAIQYFSAFSHKRQDFRKTLMKIKCVLIFFTAYVEKVSHSKNNYAKYSETCLNRTPIYRKPGQTENKFRNGVISYVK